METIGWLSILPPVVAIALAIKTREVYISLALFVWLGWTILNSWNPVVGLVVGVNTFLDAITSPGNARTLLFSALIGGIITLTQASGGMEGFIRWVEQRRLGESRRTVRLFGIGTSMLLFLESNFGLLVTGAVSRPLFDRAKISREKLSYILDATCAPKQLLIPIQRVGCLHRHSPGGPRCGGPQPRTDLGSVGEFLCDSRDHPGRLRRGDGLEHRAHARGGAPGQGRG